MATNFRKMTAHTLNPIKGWQDGHSLDFAAVPEAAAIANPTPGPIFSGMALSLNASGELQRGADDTGVTLFAFSNSDDTDVDNSAGGDPESEPDVYVPTSPSGTMTCLPATGAFELESTEVVGNDPSGTLLEGYGDFAPNTLLDALAADLGLISARVTSTDRPVIGVVSRGMVSSGYGGRRTALAFWPVWYPAPESVGIAANP